MPKAFEEEVAFRSNASDLARMFALHFTKGSESYLSSPCVSKNETT